MSATSFLCQYSCLAQVCIQTWCSDGKNLFDFLKKCQWKSMPCSVGSDHCPEVLPPLVWVILAWSFFQRLSDVSLKIELQSNRTTGIWSATVGVVNSKTEVNKFIINAYTNQSGRCVCFLFHRGSECILI